METNQLQQQASNMETNQTNKKETLADQNHQQHGNKSTLMVTKHKQKETLAQYGNKSTAAAMKFMTETRNIKRRWIVMETGQLRIRQVNVSKLSNL